MAGKGRIDQFMVFDEPASEMFIALIRASLIGIHRAGKSILPGIDHLIIPIGSLDQSHGDGSAPT